MQLHMMILEAFGKSSRRRLHSEVLAGFFWQALFSLSCLS